MQPSWLPSSLRETRVPSVPSPSSLYFNSYAPTYDELDGGAAAEALGFDELRGELLAKVGLGGQSSKQVEPHFLWTAWASKPHASGTVKSIRSNWSSSVPLPAPFAGHNARLGKQDANPLPANPCMQARGSVLEIAVGTGLNLGVSGATQQVVHCPLCLWACMVGAWPQLLPPLPPRQTQSDTPTSSNHVASAAPPTKSFVYPLWPHHCAVLSILPQQQPGGISSRPVRGGSCSTSRCSCSSRAHCAGGAADHSHRPVRGHADPG